jgi:AcrR family transcriptional regulator
VPIAAASAAPPPLDPAGGDPRAARRRRIVEAAELCFARSGFHGASMQEICAEAGMSPGALYRYFPSKDAIIGAIAEDERARARQIMTGVAGPGDFTAKLVAAALRYFAEMERPGAVPLMLEVWSEGMRNPSVAERFACGEGHVRETFGRLAAEAAARGEIDPAVDREAAIAMLLAVGEGIAVRRAVDPALALDRIAPLLAALVDGLFGRRAGLAEAAS